MSLGLSGARSGARRVLGQGLDALGRGTTDRSQRHPIPLTMSRPTAAQS